MSQEPAQLPDHDPIGLLDRQTSIIRRAVQDLRSLQAQAPEEQQARIDGVIRHLEEALAVDQHVLRPKLGRE